MANIRQFPDFMMRVSAGKVQGASLLFKFGRNEDIDTTTTPEDVHSLGGVKLFPVAASTLSIVSTSAQDGVAGTGIQQLVVEGLDSSYNLISETIITNGLTPVITVNTYLRVYRMQGILSGTSKDAIGNIIATHSEGAISEIEATRGQSADCTYTVPAGHTLLVDRLTASLERTASGAGAELHFEIKIFGTNTWTEKADISVAASGTSYLVRDSDLWFPVQEKTDIRIHIQSVSTNNTAVSASFDAILINNGIFAW